MESRVAKVCGGINSRVLCLSRSGQPEKEHEKDCEEESWVGRETGAVLEAFDTCPARGHARSSSAEVVVVVVVALLGNREVRI